MSDEPSDVAGADHGAQAAVTARHWLALASGDLQAAEMALTAGLPLRTAAGHAQQAAEKALKAILALDRDPPRTHDLAALRLMTPSELRDALADVDLDSLTQAGSAGRYPGLDDEAYGPDEAAALAEGARQVLARVTAHLRAAGVDVTGIAPR